MSLDSMTVKRKLYLSYGLLGALTLGMGVASIAILHGLAKTTEDLGVAHAGQLGEAGNINGTSAEFASLARGIYMRAENGDLATVQSYLTKYDATAADLKKSVAAMRAAGMDSGATQIADNIETTFNGSDPIFRRYIAAIQAGSFKAAFVIYTTELIQVLTKVDSLGNDLIDHQRDAMAQVNVTAQAEVTHAYWLMVVLMIVSIVVSVFLVFVIRGLDAQLRQSVHELTEGSDQVSSAATEVSSSSQSLARDTSEQAAMIEETSASAEEINAMAKRNTDSAQQATALVIEAVKSTEQTNRAVSDCVQAMDAIGDSSSRIAKTLQVIDKIAFQTNILALNAAVEAARAGEAGMGFAVVAEEVRNLAQRCAAASEEISGLIEQSLGNSDEGRAKMATLVESGEKVNQVFAQMKVLVEEISLSSEEQGRGIDQIGRAIQKMEQGTQKSAANAEESAAAAEELNAQSEALRAVADVLSQMVGVSNGGAQRSIAPTRTKSSKASSFTLPRPQSKSRPVFATAPAAGFSSADDGDFTEF